MIYPYYHLFKKDISNMMGLTGSNVKIQKKYNDNLTFVITSENGEIKIGNKKELDTNSIFRLKSFDRDFFHERDNLLFYGSLLEKRFFLWDVWDKYNNKFLDTDKHITKYKCKCYYEGPFNISLLEKFNNHIYRFKMPMLTYYVS